MMPDPCGPEMMSVFWALFRGIFCGLMTGMLMNWLMACRRRLLGQRWRLDHPDTPMVILTTMVTVVVISVLLELYKQFG